MDEVQECRDRLVAILKMVEELQSILKKRPLGADARAQAQRLLSAFKDHLEAEHRRVSKKGWDGMNETEESTYEPCVHEVIAKLNIRRNSKPGQNWIDDLHDAEFTLNWYLGGLERELAGRSEPTGK